MATTTTAGQDVRGRLGRRRKRDPVATRQRLLMAAITEFCDNGLAGARTMAIAERAKCNIRMLYHYFGNKDALYLAALEHVFEQLRERENDLELLHLDPVEGMAALVDFTFDHMLKHQEFIRLIGIENIQRGKFLKQSSTVPQAAVPLVQSIKTLLERGEKEGVMRRNVDAVQLYISILSLSYIHLSNRHTLSITFDRELSDTSWLAERRKHARDVIVGFLRP